MVGNYYICPLKVKSLSIYMEKKIIFVQKKNVQNKVIQLWMLPLTNTMFFNHFGNTIDKHSQSLLQNILSNISQIHYVKTKFKP